MNEYFWEEAGQLKSGSLSDVPEGDIEYGTLQDAAGMLQKVGCCGSQVHTSDSPYVRFCLRVLEFCAARDGRVFETVYRGTRSSRPENEYRVLFGCADKDVAATYGAVKQYSGIKGLVLPSLAKSVLTDDYSQMDEEIIFFWNQNTHV
jgi:hypothetical protein